MQRYNLNLYKLQMRRTCDSHVRWYEWFPSQIGRSAPHDDGHRIMHARGVGFSAALMQYNRH